MKQNRQIGIRTTGTTRHAFVKLFPADTDLIKLPSQLYAYISGQKKKKRKTQIPELNDLYLFFSCLYISVLRFVAKETGDDDFCDVGSVGAPGAAHTHHSEEGSFASEGERGGDISMYMYVYIYREKERGLGCFSEGEVVTESEEGEETI